MHSPASLRGTSERPQQERRKLLSVALARCTAATILSATGRKALRGTLRASPALSFEPFGTDALLVNTESKRDRHALTDAHAHRRRRTHIAPTVVVVLAARLAPRTVSPLLLSSRVFLAAGRCGSEPGEFCALKRADVSRMLGLRGPRGRVLGTRKWKTTKSTSTGSSKEEVRPNPQLRSSGIGDSAHSIFLGKRALNSWSPAESSTGVGSGDTTPLMAAHTAGDSSQSTLQHLRRERSFFFFVCLFSADSWKTPHEKRSTK